MKKQDNAFNHSPISRSYFVVCIYPSQLLDCYMTAAPTFNHRYKFMNEKDT